MHTLTRLPHNGEPYSIDLESLPYTIGRDSGNNLIFVNEYVSRRHAVIDADGEEYFIQDHDSTHGTFINGTALSNGPNPLKPGDKISLGVFPDNEEFYFDIHVRPTEQGLPEPLVEADSPISQQIKLIEAEREFEALGKLIKPRLSFNQHEVLALLWKSYPAACTLDAIAQAGWPKQEYEVGNDEIYTCISNIKKRLKENGLNPEILQNVRRYGYKLVDGPLEDLEAS